MYTLTTTPTKRTHATHKCTQPDYIADLQDTEGDGVNLQKGINWFISEGNPLSGGDRYTDEQKKGALWIAMHTIHCAGCALNPWVCVLALCSGPCWSLAARFCRALNLWKKNY